MIARPSPRVPPVIIATRPVRSNRSYGGAGSVVTRAPPLAVCNSAVAFRRRRKEMMTRFDVLVSTPALNEDVEMAEDLPDREHRLCARPPRRTRAARDLERRAAPRRRSSSATRSSRAGGTRSAPRSGRRLGDHGAVAGEARLQFHRRRAGGGRRGSRRARAAARPPAARTGVASAPDVIFARRWSPTNASCAASSTKSVSVVAVARAVDDAERPAARIDRRRHRRARRRSRSRRCCG